MTSNGTSPVSHVASCCPVCASVNVERRRAVPRADAVGPDLERHLLRPVLAGGLALGPDRGVVDRLGERRGAVLLERAAR